MSNLENLTQKILEEAKGKATSIVAEAENKAQQLLKIRTEEANEKKKTIIDNANKEAALSKERIISNAELRVRNEKLLAKQEVIEKVFSIAKDKFKNIDEEDFINFINKNTNKQNLKGTETLIVPEKFLEKAKLTGMRVSEEEFIESGFLLKDNDVVINYSFEALIDFLRDDLEIEVAQMLFKE